MPITRTVRTIDYPIPIWKGPLDSDIDPILVLIEDEPPISGQDYLNLPVFDALTVQKDARIGDNDPTDSNVEFNKISGTILDDQD